MITLVLVGPLTILSLAACTSASPQKSERPALSFKQEEAMDSVARETKHIESLAPDERASAYIERGKARLALQDYQSAIADLKEAVRLEPDRAEVYDELHKFYEATGQGFEERVARGWFEYYRQQYDVAFRIFGLAITLNPKQAEPWWGRAKATLKTARNANDALDDLNQALQRDRALMNAYLERGKIHRAVGRFDLAVADLDTFLKSKPEHVDGLVERGTALFSLGRKTQAMADFTRVLTINPLHEQALVRRAYLLFEEGNHHGAWQDADTVRRMGAGNPEALTLLGRLSYMKENFVEAVSLYDHAVRTAPGFSQTAIHVYDRIAERAPRLGATYHARGVAHYQEDRLDMAINDLTVAMSLIGEEPQAMYDRGVAYMRSGRFNEAATDFERALKHREQFNNTIISNPGSIVQGSAQESLLGYRFGGAHPFVYTNLAWTYYFLGRFEQARSAITRGLQRYEDSGSIYLAGLIEARLGDMPKAADWVGRAARTDPHNSVFAQTLAKFTKERDRAAIESWLGEMVTLGAIGLVGAGYNDYLCDQDEDCSWRRMKERERKQGR